jgi:hypothetical protein
MVQLTSTGQRTLDFRSRVHLRRPEPADYWFFFVAMPLLLALFFAFVGIGPSRTLDVSRGFAYAGSQFMAAWWGNALGCALAVRLLPRKRTPLGVILVFGHLLACLPLYLFFREHSLFFQDLFPEIGSRNGVADWSSEYLLHLLRFSSLPFLMLWFAAVFGYRQWTGVEIFGGPAQTPPVRAPVAVRAPSSVPDDEKEVVVPTAREQRPEFLAGSQLPNHAQVIAIKAEEHYIKVWSTCGTDLVRYRFGDAVADAAMLSGEQVHRSWWVRWDAVTGTRARGRSLELTLDNGLRVPVSRAYQALVRQRLEQR